MFDRTEAYRRALEDIAKYQPPEGAPRPLDLIATYCQLRAKIALDLEFNPMRAIASIAEILRRSHEEEHE